MLRVLSPWVGVPASARLRVPTWGEWVAATAIIGLRNFCQNINLPLEASTSPLNAHHTCQYTKEQLYAR